MSMAALSSSAPLWAPCKVHTNPLYQKLRSPVSELLCDSGSRNGNAYHWHQAVAHVCICAGGTKKRAVKLTGDSKVFEEGQLGEAPGGGSLTTYKELSALATEMGQPDLLYKFMDLANHASAMASTRGAAFGCASYSLVTPITSGDLISATHFMQSLRSPKHFFPDA